MLFKGDPGRFESLLSLEEIEQRLNDGCNVLSPVQVIGGGSRAHHQDKKLVWTPSALRKSEVLKLLKEKHSFLMTNMSQINTRVSGLIDSIEQGFPQDNVQADMHLYVSSSPDASGYDVHRDMPQHKLYLQVIGITQWQIFEPIKKIGNDIRSIPDEELDQKLQLVREFELQPGDAFYMPPAVFHKVRNLSGPRVSISIPFVNVVDQQIPKMDRTHIPFVEMFESAREQNQ